MRCLFAGLMMIGRSIGRRPGIAVMFDVIERGSTLRGIATIPEFINRLGSGWDG
jgi:hypothetical protein